MTYPANVFGQFQNVTVHEGDIVVGNNEIFLIENCQFNLTGRLILRDRAEVIIHNAKFISYWNTSEEWEGAVPWRTRHVIAEDEASFTVSNSELIFSAAYYWKTAYHGLLLYDQATANLTKSKITHLNGKGDVLYAHNDSKLWIRDVTLSTFNPREWGAYHPPKSGVVIFGRSGVEVQNSTIDKVYVQGNCTFNVSSSNVESLESMKDSSNIRITDSNISQISIWGPTSRVRLTNTSTETLSVRRHSKVWLFDSSIKEIWGKDKVWVVWDWPLFGQVSIPYELAPYIIPIIAIATTSSLIAVIVAFLLLRRRRRRVEIAEEINLSNS